jgi:integrase
MAELPPGPDGRRRQVTRAGYPTAEDAAAARDEVVRAHRLGTLPSNDSRRRETVAGFLTLWLTTKESSRALRPSTVLAYQRHLDTYLLPHLGRFRVRDLRRDHIEAMFSEIRQAKQLSPSTERRILATLRSAIRDAVRAGELQHDHTAYVRLPKVDRPHGQWWGADQFWAFVRMLDGLPEGSAAYRLSPVVQLVAGTGLRLGEVCGLRWSDVDLERGVLMVRQQAVQIGMELAYGKPKTRAGEHRVVPLAGWVPELLETQRKRQVAERLAFGPDYLDTPFVFTQLNGSPLRPGSVSRAFTRLVGTSGLPPCRFHDLRHVAATTLLQAGVPMPVVSKILGHSSIQITVDTYGHVTVDPALHDQVHRALSAFAR